ncbi:amino acid permease [Allostreptomyces psammosilenae]|uniref:APA family basic amino acid/polyamine antiporter n=1 Tax=Allostreptomyces psammosilenae TaxID=1892865 RepID=A0A852ZPN1_9ACTN|nr:amino acid permease [Allostreptomyces psammosilenae]NYI03210.1 APA family basic amino acid/polyamine antiporter [Allostreptomyces psammosilenae]
MARTKSVEQALREAAGGERKLRRDLGGFDLAVLGVGVILGTGIFVLTGTVAKNTAGPAAAISFVIAAAVCACAALCYAEFASTVPVAGSAYTFSYVTFGELPAWIIGWGLVLELTLAAAAVSVGWSGYLQSMLDSAGINLPHALTGEDGSFMNLPAALLIVALTGVLVVGGTLSKALTNALVVIKVGATLLVIVAGLFFVRAENYRPFVPPAESTEGSSGVHASLLETIFGIAPTSFGVAGVLTAASLVFFAYIGFDMVATSAEETRNPQRDLPVGIIGSLAVVTVLYSAVALVVTGMQHYTELSESAPLADAFRSVGAPFFAGVISLAAVLGIIAVAMICFRSQTRVFFAMSRDGLLPPVFSKVHPKYGTPYGSIVVLGVVLAVITAFVPFDRLAEMVNIGTLFAFAVVSGGVLVLRRTRPDLPRGFRTPLVPVLPIVSVLACVYLMLNLQVFTWIAFAVWFVLGLAVYYLYGRGRSHVGRAAAAGSAAPAGADVPVR